VKYKDVQVGDIVRGNGQTGMVLAKISRCVLVEPDSAYAPLFRLYPDDLDVRRNNRWEAVE